MIITATFDAVLSTSQFERLPEHNQPEDEIRGDRGLNYSVVVMLLRPRRQKRRLPLMSLPLPLSPSSPTVWSEDQPPEPVSAKYPLVGLETLVLKTWLENSRSLQRQYRQSLAHQRDLENAVRLRVHATFGEELKLRAQGLSQEQAEEFTRPAMWTPPTWPTIPPSPSPKPAAKRPGSTSSSTPF